MKLIFLRHGETKINVRGKTHQNNDPSKLTPRGVKQVLTVIPSLKKMGIEKVYCSPERRAYQSAFLLSKKLDLPLLILTDLRERNWGEWERKSWESIKRKLEKMTLKERYTFVPPHGESWQQMEKRVTKAIKKITKRKEKKVVIVTHAGALRALVPVLRGEAISKSLHYNFENGSITVFDHQGTKFKSITINNTSHLRITR